MHDSKVPLFEIPNLQKGVFLTRPNRFVSEIKYNNQVKSAHIHDPGRLTELLTKGKEVLFSTLTRNCKSIRNKKRSAAW